MLRKWFLTTSVSLVIVLLLASFNAFSILPGFLSTSLNKHYWQEVVPGQRDFLAKVLSGGLLAAAVPVLGIFAGCWHLLVHRSNNLTIRRVAERSEKIHNWLEEWANPDPWKLPHNLEYATNHARDAIRKLDRLLSTQDPKKRSIFYVLKLVCWYWPYASQITVYQADDEEIDPPLETWPIPADCVPAIGKEDSEILKGAVEFSRLFVNGAMAYVGHYYMYYAIWGSFIGGGLGVLVGGLLTLLVISLIGRWMGLIFSSLAVAMILGAATAWFWNFVLKRSIQKTLKD